MCGNIWLRNVENCKDMEKQLCRLLSNFKRTTKRDYDDGLVHT